MAQPAIMPTRLSQSSLRQIIARNVPFEQYLSAYAGAYAEWVEGMVIQMSPASAVHDSLSQFFVILLRHFLRQTGLGTLRAAPMVMRMQPDASGREPDLHIVLSERAAILKDTLTDGPADVVIEIVSPESQDRDLVEKYQEYEAGGVREYWIIHPQRQQADFYALRADGLYQRIELRDGRFESRVLSRFCLDTAVLWDRDFLKADERIRALVDAMLA
jgi:Uma2 family endonuclease